MWTIIQKEWLEIRRDRIASVLLISFALLLFMALVISWSYIRWYNDVQKHVTASARHHWETQGDKNSHSAAHYGIYLFKPLSSLALWDAGIDKHVGVSLYIEAHKRNDMQLKAVEDNPLLARWGELTPAYVFLFLLPLLVVWLASGTLGKERANGTITLVLSQGVSLGSYIWGKALMLWMLTGAFILAAWIVAGTLMSLASADNFFTIESAGVLVGYLLFNGIFIHGSLFVSLRAKHRRSALITLVGAWFIMVWFVPRLATQVSERLHPSPSTEMFKQKLAGDIALNGISGHSGTANEKMRQLERVWLEKYNVDSLQQLPLNWVGVTLQADEDTNNIIFEEHYRNLHALYARQTNVHQWSALLSPLMPARTASMALSGTDLPSSLHFSESADRYRQNFIRILNDRLRDNSRYNGRDSGTPEFWKTLPVFHYTPPSVSTKWENALTGMVILMVWLAASIALMTAAIRSVKITAL